ncbi:MAG: peptide chain release factor 1 [Puniceicoccales bacterium]|jgi:peptide chain release factor 1|nr:peptide chain release factor 1 [Puniceicoccales bacterium]
MEHIPPIENFRRRYDELVEQMSDPSFYGNRQRAAEISRERRRLEQVLDAHGKCQKLQNNLREVENFLADEAQDEELTALAREELPQLREKLERAEFFLLGLMIPEEAADSKNIIVEIRAGTGGDEASIFAGDLYRMYLRFCESSGFATESLGAHVSECGGYKEVVFSVSGENVRKTFKYESGVHRVQRVPVTEANGRIHTSAATVAVLQEAEEVDVYIAPEELAITVCRASGPGGQGVNTTDSAVQILHKPSGMIVICADERSQQKNRVKAMKVLRARLLEKKQTEEREKYASDRRSQVGSGDRSERIRTYNFPQSRLTDHRIGLTLYSLPQIMEGNLGEVIGALQNAALKTQISALLQASH